MKRIGLILIAVLFFSYLEAKTQPWVQRLEPTFWWTEIALDYLKIPDYGATTKVTVKGTP